MSLFVIAQKPVRVMLWVLISALALAMQAPRALSNADVLRMVAAGLSESSIVSAVGAQDSDFDISADALVSLKKQGVSDAILQSMIAATARKRHRTLSSIAPAASAAPSRTKAATPSTYAADTVTFFPVDFSAQRFTIAAPGASPVQDGKLFVGGGMLRFEDAAHATVTMVAPLKNAGYVIGSDGRAQAVNRFEGIRGFIGTGGLSSFFLPIKPEYPCARLKGSACRQVGTETLAGRPTQIWDVTVNFGGPAWIFKEWVDLRLHAVTKWQVGDRVTYLSNIVEAPQPESLFEVAVQPTQ